MFKKYFKSIKTKLVFGFLIVILLSVYLFAGYFYQRVKASLEDSNRQFLKSTLEEVLLELEQLDLIAISEIVNHLSHQTILNIGSQRVFFAIFDSKGRLCAKSSEYTEQEQFINVLFNQSTYSPIESLMQDKFQHNIFVITGSFTPSNDDIVYIQFALNDFQLYEMLKSFRKTIFFAIPLVGLFALGGAYLLTLRVLFPLVNMTKKAHEISIRHLDRRLPLSGTGDELDELAGLINQVFTQLQDAYERMTQFASDASHELRLPITAIKGEAEVVLGRERSLEEYQKTLESMLEEMDRLERLLNSLLVLTRGDSGEDKIEKKPVQLKHLLSKLVDFYTVLAHQKEIDLSIDCVQELSILGDELRLGQLFSNLIENALKYTSKGGKIRIYCEKIEDIFRVVVEDTGLGIGEEHHLKIFERFYRVDKGRARSEGGSGLGLAICKYITEVHQAQLTVESELNRGSRFIVEFSIQ